MNPNVNPPIAPPATGDLSATHRPARAPDAPIPLEAALGVRVETTARLGERATTYREWLAELRAEASTDPALRRIVERGLATIDRELERRAGYATAGDGGRR